MPGSLTYDVLVFLGLLSLGPLTYLLGRYHSRWPVVVRYSFITLAVLLTAFVGCVYAGLLPLEGRRVLFYLHGPKVVLALVAVYLLAVAWNEPKRSFSPAFLRFLAGVAGLMLLIEISGPLYWRCLASNAWAYFPDEQGCLRQSTVWSCGPAAAAMLLAHYAIETSEGEMAYLSRTSFFGTDGFALAHGVNEKVRARGRAATFEKTDYETCLRRHEPFVATVRTTGLFAHAVYIDEVGPESVTIVDPGDGIRKRIARAEFEEKWNGEAVYVN